LETPALNSAAFFIIAASARKNHGCYSTPRSTTLRGRVHGGGGGGGGGGGDARDATHAADRGPGFVRFAKFCVQNSRMDIGRF
jgi:hypothetical protein